MEKDSNISYLGNSTSGEEKTLILIKLQNSNQMNVKNKEYFQDCTTTDPKLRLHNITFKWICFMTRKHRP